MRPFLLLFHCHVKDSLEKYSYSLPTPNSMPGILDMCSNICLFIISFLFPVLQDDFHDNQDQNALLLRKIGFWWYQYLSMTDHGLIVLELL